MAKVAALLVQLQTPAGNLVDVGILYNANEKNWFEFDEQYWQLPDRPILGQTFEEHGRLWRPSAHVALPSWFSHLLPEGQLRDAVATAADTNKAREFNLLARIGVDDLPGAVRVGPVNGRSDSLASPPELLVAEQQGGGGDPLLKFSLAGTQLKFSVFQGRKGLTVPAKGQAGNVIVKLPDGRPRFSRIPEAELACLGLAKSSGIATPQARLVSLSEISGLEDWAARVTEPALAVDRFDRKPDDGRTHMEELAQVLNIPAQETAKYRRANFETIAAIIGGLCGVAPVGDVIDRVVLNILIGNGDAHLKNWAVLYPDGITPILSPIYDVLPTVLYIPNDDMGLKLAGSRRFESVGAESFDLLGRRTDFGVENARRRVREATERVMTNWSVLKDGLSGSNYDSLTHRLASLRLTRSNEA